MNPSGRSDKELTALLDLASEEIMSLSDDEIRARAIEEGVDLEAQGDAFRQMIKAKLKEAKLARLHRARQLLGAREAGESYVTQTLPPERVHARLSEIFQSGLIDPNSRLTLAFRSGKEMDEEDLRTLLADCEELLAQSPRESGGR